MDPLTRIRLQQRRTFLGQAARGVGSLALAALMNPLLLRADRGKLERWRGAAGRLRFKPRAKRVIVLGMAGGPSHLETFDYKPKLAEMSGRPMPESFTKGQPIAQLQGQKLVCLGPQHPFKKFGNSGQE